MQHSMKSLVEQPKNFSQYKWEAQCVCGWTTKNATKELAESQLVAHLQNNGVGVEVKPPEPKVVGEQKQGTWIPKGARANTTPQENMTTDSKLIDKDLNKSVDKAEVPKTTGIKPIGGGA